MPLFWVSLIILAVVVWFAAPPLFRPLGRFISRIWEDVKNALKEDE